MAISDDERAFFIALGQRIATQRKAQGITQVELAEQLGISQQAMNSFEKGRRRVPVSLLPVIAHTLQTTLDALVSDEPTPMLAAPKKRGPQKNPSAARTDRSAVAGQATRYRAGARLHARQHVVSGGRKTATHQRNKARNAGLVACCFGGASHDQ